VGAKSFRWWKLDSDELIWNADCGMGNAERGMRSTDPLIAAK
jgi:hypothetical protein